jgi:hypothetical protein
VTRAPGPLLVASICAGILGFTLAEATGLSLLASYVITVVVVFAVARAVTSWRRR